MRASNEAYESIINLWKHLPIGLGKDFNNVLKYIDELESRE